MFFPELIKSIRRHDKVLEIGPGAVPFRRADVYLDLEFLDEAVAIAQRGNVVSAPALRKPVIRYDGGKFPFEVDEFDYVICSHVLEHVPDPIRFCAEMFRVSKRGYVEYPLAPYEYLYNYNVHLHLIRRIGERTLGFLPKIKCRLAEFDSLQDLNRKMHEAGSNTHLIRFDYLFFEGFEWLEPFEIIEVDDVSRLVPNYSTRKRKVSRLEHLRNGVSEFKAFLFNSGS